MLDAMTIPEIAKVAGGWSESSVRRAVRRLGVSVKVGHYQLVPRHRLNDVLRFLTERASA